MLLNFVYSIPLHFRIWQDRFRVLSSGFLSQSSRLTPSTTSWTLNVPKVLGTNQYYEIVEASLTDSVFHCTRTTNNSILRLCTAKQAQRRVQDSIVDESCSQFDITGKKLATLWAKFRTDNLTKYLQNKSTTRETQTNKCPANCNVLQNKHFKWNKTQETLLFL